MAVTRNLLLVGPTRYWEWGNSILNIDFSKKVKENEYKIRKKIYNLLIELNLLIQYTIIKYTRKYTNVHENTRKLLNTYRYIHEKIQINTRTYTIHEIEDKVTSLVRRLQHVVFRLCGNENHNVV